MTTPTNWPNPERPGVPMFPEKTLRHVLKKKDTGKIIIRNWKSDGQHWDMIGHSAQWCSETYFYEGPVLTPTQISEMLVGERDRCAREAENHRSKANPHAVSEWDVVQSSTANGIAHAIRNLGDAS